MAAEPEALVLEPYEPPPGAKAVPVVATWAFVVPVYDFSTVSRLDPGFTAKGAVAWQAWGWIDRGRGRWALLSTLDDEGEAKERAAEHNDRALAKYQPGF